MSGAVSNWVLKSTLITMSVCTGALGVLGWGYEADVFAAIQASPARLDGLRAALVFIGNLSPLWPFHLIACVACVAAQGLAACGAVNFARLEKAKLLWRGLAFAFFAVGAVFAAYSADKGAKVIFSAAHMAAYEARLEERNEIKAEIAALEAVIESERRKLPDPLTVTLREERSARATFEAATASASARLPQARRELEMRPAMAQTPPPSPLDDAVFLIFLLWQGLEPWGYALAEKGRTAKPRWARQPDLRRPPPAAQSNGVPALRNAAASWAKRAATILPFFIASPAVTASPPEYPSPRVSAKGETFRPVGPARVSLEAVIQMADRMHEAGETVSMSRLANRLGISKATVGRRLHGAKINIDVRWPKPLARAA